MLVKCAKSGKMVRAWYIEGEALKNPRDEHQQLPPKFITLEDLEKITGIRYFDLNPDSESELEQFKKEHGYQFEDELVTPDESTLKEFYTEHLHENDEVRFVVEGCAYFDVRDPEEKWIRIEVIPGDLIIVPGGCYHRFMLDHKNLIRAKRLFMKDPHYKSFKRPVENLKCRQDYVNKLKSGAFGA